VTAEAVWVRDIPGAHLQLASRATGAAGAVPDGPATAPSIDGSGDRVAFRSRAGNLGSGLPASLIDWHAYVRDIRGQSTELASRANGPAGAPIDSPGPGSVSLSANGDCVAFDSTGLNVGDGFDSIWFPAVHLRVLRHECPISPPGGAITTASPAHTPKAPQPPVLSALRLVPKQFAVAPRTTARKRRQPRSALGSSIRFRLTISGRVMFSFAKQLPGRRSGKRCLPARGHVPRRKRCTRLRNVGSVSRDAKGGANRIAFSGRIRGRALALGSYRLTAIPLSASHQRGRARRAPFKIIAPR
jgi:hypothetical protein